MRPDRDSLPAEQPRSPAPPEPGASPPEPAWDDGFEGHELAQLRRRAVWPLAEKIRWLEAAHRLVLRLQHGRSDPPAVK